MSSELALESALPPDAQSLILAIADPRARDPGAIRVWALDRSDGFLLDEALTVDRGQQLYAAVYRETLPGLGMPSGLIIPDPESRRALPSGYETLLGAPLEDGAIAWKMITEIPTALTVFPFPSFDRRKCVNAGGCFDGSATSNEALRCFLPCPSSSIEPVMPVAPPAPPSPPNFLPCPSGWAESPSTDAIPSCEPPEAPVGVSCPRGSMQRYMESTCTAVGLTCPIGQWRTDVNDPVIAYVLAGGASAGDGTEANPYRSLAYALSSAPPGSTLLLSGEAYSEEVVVRAPQRIVGACPERTSIERAIHVESAGVSIENLTVAAAQTDGIVLTAGSNAVIESVVLEGSPNGSAIVAYEDGASFTLRHAYAHGWILGINGSKAMTATITDAVLEDSVAAGLIGVRGRWTADHLAIRGVTGRAVDDGIALLVQGSTMALAFAELSGARAGGVVSYNSRSTIADVFISDIDASLGGGSGGGIIASEGFLDLQRAAIRRSHTYGMLVTMRCTASVRDLFVDTVFIQPINQAGGYGIEISDGAIASIDRAHFLGTEEAGFQVGTTFQPAPSRVDAHDIWIDGVRKNAGGRYGWGVFHVNGSLELERAQVNDVFGSAIYVVQGQDAAIRDLTARHVRNNLTHAGAGMWLEQGTSVSLERARIEDVSSPALAVFQVKTATISDLDLGPVVIAPNSPVEIGAFFDGENIFLAKVRFEDIPHAGMGFVGSRTHVRGEDIRIARVERLDNDPEDVALIGAYLRLDVSVKLSRLELADLPGEGLRLEDGAELVIDDFLCAHVESRCVDILSGELIANRVHIADGADENVSLHSFDIARPLPRTAKISNWTIEAPRNDTGESTPVIGIGSTASLVADHFDLDPGTRRALIEVKAAASLSLSFGLVRGSTGSISFIDDDDDAQRRVFNNVEFDPSP